MTSFETKVISLGEVIAPNGYQRDLNPLVVDRIVNGFDAAQWDLPKAALVDGGYRIIAGQHRVEAARIFLADPALAWPFPTPAGWLDVQVIIGLDSVVEEAELFLNDAGNKKAITPYFRHRAGLVAQHQDSLDIEEAIVRHRVNLVQRQRRLSGDTFVPIQTLYSLYRRGNGKRVLDETLRLRSFWSKDDALRSEGSIIGGLGIVVGERLAEEGNTARLEKVVKRYSALKVASLAMKMVSQDNGKGRSLSQPRTYAEVLRGLLPGKPGPKTPEPKPHFDTRFPVAAEIGQLTL